MSSAAIAGRKDGACTKAGCGKQGRPIQRQANTREQVWQLQPAPPAAHLEVCHVLLHRGVALERQRGQLLHLAAPRLKLALGPRRGLLRAAQPRGLRLLRGARRAQLGLKLSGDGLGAAGAVGKVAPLGARLLLALPRGGGHGLGLGQQSGQPLHLSLLRMRGVRAGWIRIEL